MPEIKVKRAYMDDTTLGDSDLAKIKEIQQLFETFHQTGLQTLRHNCCKLRLTLQNEDKVELRTSSWTRTMGLVKEHKYQKIELWNGGWKQLSKATVRKLTNKIPDPKLDPIYTAKCTCKCKTTLICSTTPTSESSVSTGTGSSAHASTCTDTSIS
jgi:hypothetical protein